MRLKRLLETSTFRLTLAFLALFGTSALALLGFLYVSTADVLERQTRETIQAEIAGLAEQYRSEGLSRLIRVIHRRSAAHPNRASIYLLTDPQGRRIAGNIESWPPIEPDSNDWITFKLKVNPDGGQGEIRRARARVFLLGGGFQLLVGREVEDRLYVQSMIKSTLAWGLALTLLLGLAGGWLVSRGLLRRVDAINRTTSHIIAGDLTRRIELRGSRDEFDQLGANLNAMLEQIERLLVGMRQVSDNIAHDLRTPLSRMRARIEVALLRELDAEEARALLEQTLADAEAMISTFNALLAIARAEAGSERATLEPVSLDAVCADLADLYGPLAEEKGLTFSHRCPDGLTIRGNRELLAQAVANLLDNAIKYTPAGGRVTMSAARLDGKLAVTVTDTGPGVPERERERVLERFVRLDVDRSTPGNGLGLSLVAAVARLHGAKLELQDNRPGLRVRLVLEPAEPAPAPAQPALPETAPA